jgi:hypothetical protein
MQVKLKADFAMPAVSRMMICSLGGQFGITVTSTSSMSLNGNVTVARNCRNPFAVIYVSINTLVLITNIFHYENCT